MGLVDTIRSKVANFRSQLALRLLPEKHFQDMVKKSVTFKDQLPPYTSNQPIYKEYDAATALEQGLKASYVAWKGLMFICKNVGSIPWFMERKTAGGKWVRWPNSPGEQLIENPNQFQSRQDLMQRWIMHLYMAGNGLVNKVRGSNRKGPPIELWTVEPDGVFPRIDSIDYIKYYEYRAGLARYGGGNGKVIEVTDMMHIMFPDPQKPWWGLGPFQVMQKLLQVHGDQVDWWKVSFQNRAVPDGVFSVQSPSITDDQYTSIRTRLREQLNETASGQAKARDFLILSGGTMWQQMSMSPVEMDWIDSSKLTREDILMVLGVLPPLVGILDNATLANIEVARLIFWQDHGLGLLDDFRTCLNRCLAPEFGENVRFNYDTSGVAVLQESISDKMDDAKSLFAIGYPVNAINERLGLDMPPLPEVGDIGFLPGNLVPTMLLIGPDEEPEDEEEDVDGDVTEEDEDPGIDEDLNETGEDNAEDEEDSKHLLLRRNVRGGRSRGRKSSAKVLNLRSAAARGKYWKRFDRQRLNWEKALRARILGLSQMLLKAVVKHIKAGRHDVDGIVDSHRGYWETVLISHWRSVIDHFGTQTARELGGDSINAAKSREKRLRKIDPCIRRLVQKDEPDYLFDPWTAAIKEYVEREAATRITGINEVTKDQLRRAIGQALEEGQSVDQLANQLEMLYNGLWERRSFAIARTEVIAASNYGAKEAASQSGLPLKKQWTTSRDDRVRESHDLMDGEITEMDTPYSNGLMFPGDPSGHPSEVVQCRCVEVYLMDGEVDG